MTTAKLDRLTFKTKPEGCSWDSIRDMWMEGERIEAYDGGFLFDHFYPIYGDPTGPCFEGWTALSFLAGKTERLRLGLMVTGNPYRHPAVLANMAATFDVFSGGRLDLGIGAGWNEVEAAAYGIELLPIGQRLDQFEEAARVLTSLLSEPTTDHDGKHYRLVEAYCEPKPLQSPHPPIVMGGVGEKRMLAIVARWADDWNYPGGSVEDFRHKLDVLRGHCERVGRDASAITPSCHIFVGDDPNATGDMAAGFVEAGARHINLYYTDLSSPALMGPTAEAVLTAVG